MQIQVPSNAPAWAFALGKTMDQALNNNIWPFVARNPLMVAELTAAFAAKFPYGMVFVKDPPANQYVAISNGGAWFYLDGTAV